MLCTCTILLHCDQYRMQLVWSGDPTTVEKKTFSTYSSDDLLDIVRHFPKVELDDGSIQDIRYPYMYKCNF